MSEKLKAKLFTEFKSTLMDEKFPVLKKKMIEEIKTVNNLIIYSVYVKKDKRLESELKQSLYIRMLSKIIESIGQELDIVFDKCSNSAIDDSIVKTISALRFVKSIRAEDSQLTPGLQLVDNMCSIIRRKYSNSDINNHFVLIEGNVK